MPRVLMYTQNVCPYCDRAKAVLQSKGVQWEEINIERVDGARDEMIERSRQRTVPQIWIDDVHVGGSDELFALDAEGKLDPLLGVRKAGGGPAIETKVLSEMVRLRRFARRYRSPTKIS